MWGKSVFCEESSFYSSQATIYIILESLYYTTTAVGDCNYISLDVGVVLVFAA